MLGLSPLRFSVLVGHTLICGVLVLVGGGGPDWTPGSLIASLPWLAMAMVWLSLPIALLVFARGGGATTAIGAVLLSLASIWFYSRDFEGYAALFLPVYLIGPAICFLLIGYSIKRWGPRRV